MSDEEIGPLAVVLFMMEVKGNRLSMAVAPAAADQVEKTLRKLGTWQKLKMHRVEPMKIAENAQAAINVIMNEIVKEL